MLVLDQPRVLQITLFGCPRVIRPQLGPPSALGHKANELLALLLLGGHHSHHREKLATTLWSESPPVSAAHSFRTTLCRLRRALEPSGVARGTYLSITRPGEVGFNWQCEHLVDVLEFQDTLSCCNSTNVGTASDTDLRSIERALRLYEGELLEGYFEDWIIYERERLRDLFIRGLSYLMRELMRRQNYHQAISCGRRALAEDPLRESVYRDLMGSYVEVGQRAEAIKLYERLSSTLDTELEVAPAKETTEVYVRILQLEGRTQSASNAACGREIVETVNALQFSLDALEQEQKQMSRALDSLKELLSPQGDAPD